MTGTRVLVTGASGFIGRHCVEALMEKGCEVHGVSRAGASCTNSSIQWHQSDLLEPTAFDRLFALSRPTHVIHAAWDVSSGKYWTSADNLVWSARSSDLLRAAQRHGVERVVGIGTCAEYGLEHELCDETTSAMRPVGVYARAKHAAQLLFAAGAESLGVSTAWVRLFFPYGTSDKPEKLVPYTIRQLLEGKPAELSPGTQVRDPLFAGDVGRAIVAVLFSDLAGGVNVASGQGLSIAELVMRIAHLIGRPELIRLGVRASNSAEAQRWVASIERLTSELEWRPRFSLEEGLRQTISSIQAADKG